MAQDLFGTAGEWPPRVTSAGQLALVTREDALWQGIDQVLTTPLGTRPLDPTFGAPPVVLEPIGSPEAIAYALGRAIERSEPRVKGVQVDILRDDVANGTLELRIWITPISTNVPLNRTYPLYRKA